MVKRLHNKKIEHVIRLLNKSYNTRKPLTKKEIVETVSLISRLRGIVVGTVDQIFASSYRENLRAALYPTMIKEINSLTRQLKDANLIIDMYPYTKTLIVNLYNKKYKRELK